MVKIAQLASIAGPQSRVAQPETPVTLQFQGNKFTLSHSQLRQLTAGQPLQLQGKRQPADTHVENLSGWQGNLTTEFQVLHPEVMVTSLTSGLIKDETASLSHFGTALNK